MTRHLSPVPKQLNLGAVSEVENNPSDHDLEQALIALAFTDETFADDLIAKANSNFFDLDAHRELFDSVKRVRAQNMPVDQHVVYQDLSAHNRLHLVTKQHAKGGSASLISKICEYDFQVHPANVDAHLATLAEYAYRRACNDLGTRVLLAGHNPDIKNADFFRMVAGWFEQIEPPKQGTKPTLIYESMQTRLTNLDLIWKGQKPPPTLTTGSEEFDRLTGGMRFKSLITLAADSGCGKTAQALCIASAVAASKAEKRAVLICSIEMEKEELDDRFICMHGHVDESELAGPTSDANLEKIYYGANKAAALPIFLSDDEVVSLESIRANIRHTIKDLKEHGNPELGLVVIDHLQICKLPDGANRDEQISAFTSALKRMAKEFNIVILLLSQFNRKIGENQGGRPSLSALKGSGSIEQDSNQVWFLYRPYLSLLNRNTDNARAIEGMTEFISAKNRSRKLGTVELNYVGSQYRFEAPSEANLATWRAALAMTTQNKKSRNQHQGGAT